MTALHLDGNFVDALEHDRLYAAGLDVFCDEPPLANRDALLAHPHVIAIGHYAWYSIGVCNYGVFSLCLGIQAVCTTDAISR